MAGLQIIEAREVPLGGLRAMTVRRTLPSRDRSFVGAWCFADHYGPTRVGADGPGMDVAPHPHTGLQTVSWLFTGEIEHRDSAGNHALVRPGEMNLMTGGHGICHSEVSTPDTTVLHGVQLWVALPSSARDAPRAFAFHPAEPVELPSYAGQARVFLGSLADVGSSPVQTHTPLVGAQLDLVAAAELTLRLDPAYEYGFLVDQGEIRLDDERVVAAELGVLDTGREAVTIRAGAQGARVVLIGGEPFEEEIVMWWNFVARTHEEIEAFRAEWEAEGDRFGAVEGYTGVRQRIPAPALPGVRLRPRGRHGRR